MGKKSLKALFQRSHVPVLHRASKRYVFERSKVAREEGLKYKDQGTMRAISKRSRDFQPGDHLVTPRRLAIVDYTHHGMYIGNGKVIHYSGSHRGLHSGTVCLAWVDDFADKQDIMVERYPNYSKGVRQYALQRAIARRGERKYRLLTRNCEHFVRHCITGKSKSFQVERWAKKAGYVVNTVSVFAVALSWR